jgi:hypothetical protein
MNFLVGLFVWANEVFPNGATSRADYLPMQTHHGSISAKDPHMHCHVHICHTHTPQTRTAQSRQEISTPWSVRKSCSHPDEFSLDDGQTPQPTFCWRQVRRTSTLLCARTGKLAFRIDRSENPGPILWHHGVRPVRLKWLKREQQVLCQSHEPVVLHRQTTAR